MKIMPPDVISHENQLQHLSKPSIFILDVFRTADHAGQIFIPHRPRRVAADYSWSPLRRLLLIGVPPPPMVLLMCTYFVILFEDRTKFCRESLKKNLPAAADQNWPARRRRHNDLSAQLYLMFTNFGAQYSQNCRYLGGPLNLVRIQYPVILSAMRICIVWHRIK